MAVMSDFFWKISKNTFIYLFLSMSVHEGVSCDACGKSNFRSKRYKCLICYDYDLCSTCYEQGETSSNHTSEHPMQCNERKKNFFFLKLKNNFFGIKVY